MQLTTLKRITGFALFAALAMPAQMMAQQEQEHKREHLPHYRVKDLGSVGMPPGQPYAITNNGLISGAAAIPGGTMHAVLWYKGRKLDIGSRALGGPNSAAFGGNQTGEAVGEAETLDANDEDFCGFNAFGFPSSTACLPFMWKSGVMTKLPTLGGPNGAATMINNRGEVVGYAEKDRQEGGCPVLQFEPVTWKGGKIRQLPTFGDDPDGVAAQINENGQVVGSSGTCGSFNPNSGLYLIENHALLWEKDGSVHDLGNLGGTGGIAGNHACALNNHGQVVGHSELPNNASFHGFLWTRETGMRDLHTLPQDSMSLALGINDSGEVVGASLDANFSPRAFVWKNGVMTDLNNITRTNSGLYLLLAFSVNSRGEIVGVGATNAGEIHGFLAIPCNEESD
jgi:probable HAF family extracellular repeat protein